MAAFRTHVEFRSDAFPPRPGEEINPGRWGAALVEYLKAELPARGIELHRVFTEDWRYAIDVKNPDFRLWIGCGNYEGFEDGFRSVIGSCWVSERSTYADLVFELGYAGAR